MNKVVVARLGNTLQLIEFVILLIAINLLDRESPYRKAIKVSDRAC